MRAQGRPSSRWAAALKAACVGLAWAVCAISALFLRENYGAQLLLWPGTAIAVAALLGSPRRDWPLLLGSLALASAACSAWWGMSPGQILTLAAASVAEPLIIAGLMRVVRPEKSGRGLMLRDLVMLFAASLAGAAAGAAIAYPAWPEPILAESIWRILAVTLGVLVCMPLVALLKNLVSGAWGGAGPMAMSRDDLVGAAISFAAMLPISALVLHVTTLSLSSLIVVAIVVLVVRYGHIAAAAGVLAFAVAATIESVGGHSPAPFLTFTPDQAGLVLQAFMLLLLGTALPLASMLIARDRMDDMLQRRNAKLRENLTMLAMAERLAGIGRWRYDFRTGAQCWSAEMFRIHGLDPSLPSDPGDLSDMLPDGGRHLNGVLADHRSTRVPYDFEYEILRPDGESRILHMFASNEFGSSHEADSMLGVVTDVTEHRRRQEAAESERIQALQLAAAAQLLAKTDALTQLANRRRTLSHLESLVLRCNTAPRRELAVIAFDIDHFKQINDRYGHQTGDQVLVGVAEIAQQQSRSSDLVGRTGGEEFLWLLPGANAYVARSAAERLRAAVEQDFGNGPLPAVTISIGYALWRDGDDLESLLGRVDRALYEAKGQGRNQVRQAA